MKYIDLISLEDSNVKYRIDRFPDGEVQFVMTEELNRKEEYTVICRVTNAEELFILLQVGDILDRQAVIWSLDIRYLMGMRMDRVMSFERPFTLRIVGKMISQMGYEKCSVYTAHSVRTMMEIRDCTSVEYSPYHFLMSVGNGIDLVFPDHGAVERYKVYQITDEEEVYFEKVRDKATEMKEKVSSAVGNLFSGAEDARLGPHTCGGASGTGDRRDPSLVSDRRYDQRCRQRIFIADLLEEIRSGIDPFRASESG